MHVLAGRVTLEICFALFEKRYADALINDIEYSNSLEDFLTSSVIPSVSFDYSPSVPTMTSEDFVLNHEKTLNHLSLLPPSALGTSSVKTLFFFLWFAFLQIV